MPVDGEPRKSCPPDGPCVYAAVDIGSHSVRMDVVEVAAGEPWRLIATERDVARLGESVFRTGEVGAEAMDRVCAILHRMAPLRVPAMRAVATAALRDAANQSEFVARTSAALGAPVEIISGDEEARLIRLGVRSRSLNPDERRLIIDVGGGSTEIIAPEKAWSLPLGALRLQMLFLRHDPPTPDELAALNRFIAEQAASALRELSGIPFDRVIGTSATARAVVSGIAATTVQIREFYRSIVALDMAERRMLEGIGPLRAEIIVPGTAVILHILDALTLPELAYSPAGVRDGIIADLAASGI